MTSHSPVIRVSFNLFPNLKDFYNEYDELDVTESDRKEYRKYIEDLEDRERSLLETDHYFYVVDLANRGGLVMPVILGITYVDGSTEEMRIPAEIWRRNAERVSKLILAEREIEEIVLDPHLETSDVERANNTYPPRPSVSRFQIYKRDRNRSNPMREAAPEGVNGESKEKPEDRDRR